MTQATITFHIDDDKWAAVDAIAASLYCDRSSVMNAALDAYLELYAWQVKEIKAAVQEAEADDFARAEDVQATFARLNEGAAAEQRYPGL